MARREHDREDLLGEATALVTRIELDVQGYDEPVTIGWRRDGAGSIYLGQDPVYQFNSRGQLRRGFVDGLLIKAEKGSLASLDRTRQSGEIQLVRHDFSLDETTAFLVVTQRHLMRVREAIRGGYIRVRGQVSLPEDALAEIGQWLDGFEDNITIASVPNAR